MGHPQARLPHPRIGVDSLITLPKMQQPFRPAAVPVP